MKLRAGNILALLTIAAALAADRPLPCLAQAPAQVGTGVRYVSHDKQGRLQAEILGDSAQLLPDGSIVVSGLSMNIFEPDGVTVSARVTADKCVYRSAGGQVESDSVFKMVQSSAVVSGVGFKWSPEDRVVRVLSSTRVELDRGEGFRLNLKGIR